jgi:hypothetical protein
MAVQDPTSNFGWNIPNNLGDSGNWGAILREIFGESASAGAAPNGSIDTILGDTQTTADAAMPKAGGVFTGEIDVLTARYELVDLGSALDGAVQLDLDAGNFFFGTLDDDITISFTNVPADGVFIVLELTSTGAHSVTWPGSVRWPNGTQPSLTSGGVDILTLFTRDAGTTWRGALAMEDSS